MRRSVITILMTLGILAGGVASAAPGPNGHNDFGLCKAYFAGSQTGLDNKRSKGPFPGLEAKAGDFDGDGDRDEDDVRAFCATTTPGGKGNTTPTPGGQEASTGSASGGGKGGSRK